MDVGPVGSGLSGADLARAAGPVAPAPNVAAANNTASAPASVSIDAALLETLSQPDLARLLAIFEPLPSSQGAARVSELVEAMMTAAAAGDVERVLQHVTQLAALDPVRIEGMRAEPGLELVRPQLDSLLTRLPNVAKLDAQSRIAEATQLAEGSRLNALPEWDARPEVLLAIANRLVEAGGYVNAVRATQVAQVVVDGTRWAPAQSGVAAPALLEPRNESEIERGIGRGTILSAFRDSWRIVRSRAPGRLSMLWKRAPLLVLLLSWLAVGTAGGLASWVQQRVWPGAWPPGLSDAGTTLWAIGFLALVLFGFYMRVKNIR